MTDAEWGEPITIGKLIDQLTLLCPPGHAQRMTVGDLISDLRQRNPEVPLLPPEKWAGIWERKHAGKRYSEPRGWIARFFSHNDPPFEPRDIV